MADHAERALHARTEAALAGHAGDEPGARAHLADEDATVRATAFSALVRMGRTTKTDVEQAINDPSPAVRRNVAELSPVLHKANFRPLLEDDDPSVVEAGCFAVGEQSDRRAVERLMRIAAEHSDPLCREAAVAALGAIGDERARAAVLAALDDRPAVRRRAAVALAAFEGPDVDAALERALADRDWQVRQAAEDVKGRAGVSKTD